MNAETATIRAAADGFVVPLRDGSPVLVRPVGPDDREALVEAFGRLSDRSVYQRFFRPLRRLDDRLLDGLVAAVDGVDHVAWAALDPTVSGVRGLALGRFVRERDDPSRAEVAFTVVDDHQRRGLGTLLLAVLMIRAEALGLQTLRAFALPENQAVTGWLRTYGASVQRDGPLVVLDLPVGEPNALPPAPAAERFLGLVERLRPLVEGRHRSRVAARR